MLLAFAGDAKGIYHSWRDAQDAALRARIVLELTEDTQARLALGRQSLDSLRGAKEAADSLNGVLIAALAIKTKPDTVVVYDSTVATNFDSTSVGVRRTATLTDTTEAGYVVTVRADAPAVQTAPLGLGYDLFIPSFRPEIGFVETSLGVFATVTWANQQFSVEAPYFKTQKENPDPLQVQIGSRLLTTQSGVTGTLFYDVYAQLAYYPNKNLKLTVPVGLQPGRTYIGVSFEKTIFRMPSLSSLLPF